MASRKRPRSPSADEDDEDRRIRSPAMRLMRILPPGITERIYPYSFCVLETNKELREAVDHHMLIVTTEEASFPAGYCPIGEWDVSRITDFSNVFSSDRNQKMRSFDEDIGDWDVSNGTIFADMFCGCERFNADLSRWNVGNGTEFDGMFQNCPIFDSDV